MDESALVGSEDVTFWEALGEMNAYLQANYPNQQYFGAYADFIATDPNDYPEDEVVVVEDNEEEEEDEAAEEVEEEQEEEEEDEAVVEEEFELQPLTLSKARSSFAGEVITLWYISNYYDTDDEEFDDLDR